MTTETPTGINCANVQRWLTDNIAGAEPPYRYDLLQGGHSNLTFKVTDRAGAERVLRRPPLGHVLATAHDMAREHRIVGAVGNTDVPVPEVLGLCEDVTVNDAPFYVMSYVAGDVLADTESGRAVQEPDRAEIGRHLFELLADLHSVDPDDIGLGELARKEDYLGRQLKRWTKQWESSKTRELPAMDETRELLERLKPEQIGASIVHGDWRLPNMLIQGGRIVACLDWELCTLGDPLADLGYIVNYWSQPGEPLVGRDLEPSRAGGFLSRDEVLDIYSERSGRDVSLVAYYRAFSHWRGAAISEGVLARYLDGSMGDDKELDFDLQRAGIDFRADEALRMISELA